VGSGQYVVSVTHVGHLNDIGSDEYEFCEKRGVVECETHRGCVFGDSAVITVYNHDDDDSSLELELFPTLHDFAVNIMCEKSAERVVSCEFGEEENRNGANAVLQATLDDAFGRGCTIVGSGVGLASVQITARCEPDES